MLNLSLTPYVLGEPTPCVQVNNTQTDKSDDLILLSIHDGLSKVDGLYSVALASATVSEIDSSWSQTLYFHLNDLPEKIPICNPN